MKEFRKSTTTMQTFFFLFFFSFPLYIKKATTTTAIQNCLFYRDFIATILYWKKNV